MAEINDEQIMSRTTTTTTTPPAIKTTTDDEHFENDDDGDDFDDDSQINMPNSTSIGVTDFSTPHFDNSAETDYYGENNGGSQWSDDDGGYDVEYDDNDDDNNEVGGDDTADKNTVDDAIYRQFFEQLIEAKKLSALKQQNAQFFPSTRRYLTTSFANREKMLNKRMQNNLLYIARCIVDGKIVVNLPEVDKEFMMDILDSSTPKEDVRLYLLEDRRLLLYFRKALRLIEAQQNKQSNGGQRKKANNDRQRKVQRANGSVAGNHTISKNSQRFNSNTRRGRAGGESSRNDEISAS
jgi:hypothetical protein